MAQDASGRRQKRQSKQALRQLMVDAGRAIVNEEGIETSSNNLTFKRVFERVERDTGRHLTNASIIKRIWENQSDYQADVLVAISHDEGRPEIEGTLDVVRSVIDGIDRSSVEGRMRGMSQLCRVAGDANRQVLAASTSRSLWISVMAIASTSSNEEQRNRMCDALAEGYDTVTDFWAGVYSGLIAFLGLRVREPRTVRQFVLAATSVSEGDILRYNILREMPTLMLPSGPGGECQEWSLFALSIEALALQFFEPDPDFVAP